ncbi:haloacid dehalogenase type II [Aquabacter sp. CN5-332]|uniref:haloacid dehalogenase type II n=1 Tax=Aquabacter sp. CN5-332 TaxID=3156608 RepID=UPI0032B570B4
MIKAFVFDAYGTLYDVQSVADILETSFPGCGDLATQMWRIKQLEYSWLRSMMRDYQDFWAVTRQSLTYTLDVLGLTPTEALFETIAEAYNNLRLYPDAEDALGALKGYRLAILSNGSPDMLAMLGANSDLDRHVDAIISVDSKKVFEPDPRAYELIEERLGLSPAEVIFVSSNGFDISGAKHFGFRVARIERVSQRSLLDEIIDPGALRPATMFKALRTQAEALGQQPDFVISSLLELAHLPSAIEALPAGPASERP